MQILRRCWEVSSFYQFPLNDTENGKRPLKYEGKKVSHKKPITLAETISLYLLQSVKELGNKELDECEPDPLVFQLSSSIPCILQRGKRNVWFHELFISLTVLREKPKKLNIYKTKNEKWRLSKQCDEKYPFLILQENWYAKALSQCQSYSINIKPKLFVSHTKPRAVQYLFHFSFFWINLDNKFQI